MENNPLLNYRYHLINNKGEVTGKIEVLISQKESGEFAQQLRDFFKAEGMDINVVGGIMPIEPGIAEIVAKLDEIAKRLPDPKAAE